MATVDQSAENAFTMSDADTHSWQPVTTGWYRLRVGSGGSPNFNGQSINAEQDGDSLTGLSAMTAYTDKLVHLYGGIPLLLIPSGAVTSVPVRIVKE